MMSQVFDVRQVFFCRYFAQIFFYVYLYKKHKNLHFPWYNCISLCENEERRFDTMKVVGAKFDP